MNRSVDKLLERSTAPGLFMVIDPPPLKVNDPPVPNSAVKLGVVRLISPALMQLLLPSWSLPLGPTTKIFVLEAMFSGVSIESCPLSVATELLFRLTVVPVKALGEETRRVPPLPTMFTLPPLILAPARTKPLGATVESTTILPPVLSRPRKTPVLILRTHPLL